MKETSEGKARKAGDRSAAVKRTMKSLAGPARSRGNRLLDFGNPAERGELLADMMLQPYAATHVQLQGIIE